MRKFKKLLAVGACLCMSLSLLAGCGSGSGNASGSGSSDSGTKQESTKSSDLSFAFVQTHSTIHSRVQLMPSSRSSAMRTEYHIHVLILTTI